MSDVFKYWNWVLDSVISDDTSTKCCSWGVYPCIGLGHIGQYINKMLFMGVSWVIDKMDLIGFINKMF